MASIPAEPFTAPLAFHGEGPVWYDGWEGLRFVDMLAGDIVCLDSNGQETRRIHVGEVAAAFRPRRSEGMVAAVERGFALIDQQGQVTTLPELWTDGSIRMNEGGCDPQGRFYCGSMAYDLSPGAGTIWRLDGDGRTTTAVTDVTVSNGLAWSPDATRAYYIDSLTYRVDIFDDDPARGLVDRRPFIHIPEELGLPDGMTVDASGALWVAFFGGSAVRRYGSDGRLEAVIELPVSQVTACTFGGPQLDQLYITTSREGIGQDDQPDAGCVFVAQPGATGMPVQLFAG